MSIWVITYFLRNIIIGVHGKITEVIIVIIDKYGGKLSPFQSYKITS